MKNRQAAQTARDRKKARLTELELQVERLRQEKAEVEARCTAAEKRVTAMEAEFELARSTRYISLPGCPYCEHLHQSQGHPSTLSDSPDWYSSNNDLL